MRFFPPVARWLPCIVFASFIATACKDKGKPGPEMPSTDDDAPRVAERLHADLVHTDHPFAIDELSAAADGTLTGRGVVSPDELPHWFTFADGRLATSPIGATYSAALANQSAAFAADGRSLWRVDLASLEAQRVSGDEVVASFVLSPDQSLVAYIARDTSTAKDELFVVGTQAGANPVRLTHGDYAGSEIVSASDYYGGQATRPRVLADNSRVLFVAADDDYSSLWSVTTDGSGLVKLSGDGTVGGDYDFSFSFTVASDSSRVVFVSEDDTEGVKELYAIDPDGANKVKLSGTLAPGASIDASFRGFGAAFLPDASHVIFFADLDGDGKTELRKVAPDGSGLAALSTAAEAVDGVFWPRFTSTSATVLYASDSILRAVDLVGGAPRPLTPATSFRNYYELGPIITPDDTKVIYGGDESGSSNYSLYIAALDGSSKVRLNPPFTGAASLYSGSVGDAFAYLTPSGHIVYRARVDSVPDYAFYIVDADGSNHRRVSPPKTQPSYLSTTYLGEYGGKVYFTADPSVWTRYDLFSFDVATSELVNVSEQLTAFVTEDVSSTSLVRDSGTLWAAATSYSFDSILKEVLVGDMATGTSCRVALPLTASSRVGFLAAPTLAALGEVYLYEFDGAAASLYRANTSCELSTIFDPPLSQVFGNPLQLTPDRQHIVFVDVEGPTRSLFSVDHAGQGRIRLSGDMTTGGNVMQSNEGGFALSPTSTRVVYAADQDTDEVMELYAVDVTGGNATKLSPTLGEGGSLHTSGSCFLPRFTPNGERVVFVARTTSSGASEVYAVKADGSELVKVSGDLSGPGYLDSLCAGVVLTADSTRVVYRVYDDARADIYVSPLASSAPVKLSGQLHPDEDVGDPTVTADGQHVIYVSSSAGDVYRLIASRTDGGGSAELQIGAASSYPVVIQPLADGRVVYTVYEGNNLSLRISKLDGSNAVVLVQATNLVQLAPSATYNPTIAIAGNRVFYVTTTLESDGSRTSRVYEASSDGQVVKMVTSAPQGRTIQRIELSADESRLLVVGDLERKGVFEFFALAL